MSIKSHAQYFHYLGMNVTCVSNIKNEFNSKAENLYLKAPNHKWEDLWSRRQTLEEFHGYQWSTATGFGLATGFDNLLVVDMDNCSRAFVKQALEVLGLPVDYEWVVLSGSRHGFHVHVFVDDLLDTFPETAVVRLYPKESYTQLVSKVELLIRLHSILPPSTHPTHNKYEFVNCSVPRRPPVRVGINKIQDFINTYFDIARQENKKTYKKGNKSIVNPVLGPVSDTEEEPHYPTLSGAAWALTTTVVSGIIGFGFPPAFIFTFLAGMFWLTLMNDPAYAIERRDKNAFLARREELVADRRAVVRAELQEAYLRLQNVAYEQRQEVRRMIENMLEYQTLWRQPILQRDGGKCVICLCTGNLEVDHIESLDSIIRIYGITNEDEARACSALWDTNNGRTLCKSHHDQTETSKYRASRL